MPARLRASPVFGISPLERKAEPRAVTLEGVIVYHDAYTSAAPAATLAISAA